MSKEPETTSPTETLAADTQQPGEVRKPKTRKSKPGKALAVVKSSKRKALLAANAEKLQNLAEKIRGSQESITLLSKSAREKMEDTMVEVARCGKLLRECKAVVGHGDWQKWMRDNLKLSISTAQRYMRVAKLAWSKKERALFLEEPKSIRQTIAFLSDPGKKADPKKEKGGAGPDKTKDQIQRVTSLAKRLLDTLHRLPREKQNEAFEALDGIREWMKASSIDVKATKVG